MVRCGCGRDRCSRRQSPASRTVTVIAASSAWELPGRSFASPLRLAAMGAIAAEPGWGGVLRGCGRFCGRRRSVCARGGATVAEVTADDRGGYRGGDGGGEEADAERVR